MDEKSKRDALIEWIHYQSKADARAFGALRGQTAEQVVHNAYLAGKVDGFNEALGVIIRKLKED